MPQVVVKAAFEADGTPREWFILDLQGTIDCSDVLGTLAFNSKGGPELTVGNHILEGTIVKLKKPLAVLYDTAVSTKAAMQEESSTHKQFAAVAIVKRKILFTTRPRVNISDGTRKKLKFAQNS